MILEIISRVASGLIILTWIVSLILAKKHEKAELLFGALSICLFVVGFVDALRTVFGL